MKVVLSRKAVLLQGALTGYLLPKMAADAKYDATPILKGLTAKNFKELRPKLAADVKAKVKLAKDMSLDDFENFMDRMEKSEVAEGADADPSSGLPMSKEDLDKSAKDAAEEEEKKKAADKKTARDNFLKGKGMDDADIEAMDALCAEGEDAFPDNLKDKEGEDAADPAIKPGGLDKAAMDAAIKVACDATEKRVLANQKAIATATDYVAPKAGKLAMAHDSVEGVYRSAIKALGMKVDGVEALPVNALKAIFDAAPDPNAARTVRTLASDSALDGGAGFNERFGGAASRIGRA